MPIRQPLTRQHLRTDNAADASFVEQGLHGGEGRVELPVRADVNEEAAFLSFGQQAGYFRMIGSEGFFDQQRNTGACAGQRLRQVKDVRTGDDRQVGRGRQSRLQALDRATAQFRLETRAPLRRRVHADEIPHAERRQIAGMTHTDGAQAEHDNPHYAAVLLGLERVVKSVYHPLHLFVRQAGMQRQG